MQRGIAADREVLRRVRFADRGAGATAEYKQVTVLFAELVIRLGVTCCRPGSGRRIDCVTRWRLIDFAGWRPTMSW